MEEPLALIAEASTEYVGRWNTLISTTNWEKGRIISEWRKTLADANASANAYSDEAWSRQVGGVTPQHTGRLRRVYERFGNVQQDYAGLYWSHFQVALDWEDAEMWLEGAVQNRWSVAGMCDQRWEALGAPPELQPKDSDIVLNEVDEDVVSVDREMALPNTATAHAGDDADSYFGEDDADTDATSFDDHAASDVDRSDSVQEPAAEAPAPVRPFEALPTMPADMHEAFELFKLAILNHKVSGWQEIARDDVLCVLDALRQLATAPAE